MKSLRSNLNIELVNLEQGLFNYGVAGIFGLRLLNNPFNRLYFTMIISLNEDIPNEKNWLSRIYVI